MIEWPTLNVVWYLVSRHGVGIGQGLELSRMETDPLCLSLSLFPSPLGHIYHPMGPVISDDASALEKKNPHSPSPPSGPCFDPFLTHKESYYEYIHTYLNNTKLVSERSAV